MVLFIAMSHRTTARGGWPGATVLARPAHRRGGRACQCRRACPLRVVVFKFAPGASRPTHVLRRPNISLRVARACGRPWLAEHPTSSSCMICSDRYVGVIFNWHFARVTVPSHRRDRVPVSAVPLLLTRGLGASSSFLSLARSRGSIASGLCGGSGSSLVVASQPVEGRASGSLRARRLGGTLRGRAMTVTGHWQ
jgi:hypothetical protein